MERMMAVKVDEKFPSKIHIIGSVGSGKTTLARNLAAKRGMPFFELDSVVWQRGERGDIRRSDEERDKCLNDIIDSQIWIVEGAQYQKWIMPSIEKAELIIFLDTSYSKRIFRIIKRFILQKIRMEKANYEPTLKIFINMFKWNFQFEKRKLDILAMLSQYNDKLIILKDNSEIENIR